MEISKLKKRIVLKNGTILNPLAGTQKKGDILIEAVSYTHLTLPTILLV